MKKFRRIRQAGQSVTTHEKCIYEYIVTLIGILGQKNPLGIPRRR
jgi:hypothetical protein